MKFTLESIQQPDRLKDVGYFLLKQPAISKCRKDLIVTKGIFEQQLLTERSVINETFVATKSDGKLMKLITLNDNFMSVNQEQAYKLAFVDAVRSLVCSGATAIELLTSDENSTFIKAVTTSAKELGISIKSADLTALNEKGFSAVLQGECASDLELKSIDFKTKGDLIFILGESVEDVQGSTYLKEFHKIESTELPGFDVKAELNLQNVLKDLIRLNLVNAAHNCSAGGIFVALTEMTFKAELGYDVVTDSEIREDAFLFGESPSRVIVSVGEAQEDAFIEFMVNSDVNSTLLGHVTKGKLVIDDEHYGFCDEAKSMYLKSLLA